MKLWIKYLDNKTGDTFVEGDDSVITGMAAQLQLVPEVGWYRVTDGEQIISEWTRPKPRSPWTRELSKIDPSKYDSYSVQVTFTSGSYETPSLCLTQKQFEQIKGFMLSIEEGLI